MIAFSKYHGCGNDFIILTAESIGERDYSEFARQICHRTLGVGADGFIIVKQDPLEMIFYNSDGSRAPMCGNGIRCFAKYCYDENICTEERYPVETLAGTMGIKRVGLEPFLVEINMGKPDFDPKRCGIKTSRDNFLNQRLQLKNSMVEISSCFMGTIHTVVWLDNLNDADLQLLGEEISNHPLFAEKTNVNMAQVLGSGTIKLMTYERGAGMTYACGTGACATVVLGAKEGKCDKDAYVILPYGGLHIQQNENDEVMMTGPAVRIAKGTYEDRRENDV
ncbi:MAG: diaminopimelate epimerase [Clostridia bacterium]|nr:diaminopimelate epimerase [Clostridia bacterium]